MSMLSCVTVILLQGIRSAGHDILQCTWSTSHLTSKMEVILTEIRRRNAFNYLIMKELKSRGINNNHTLAYLSGLLLNLIKLSIPKSH